MFSSVLDAESRFGDVGAKGEQGAEGGDCGTRGDGEREGCSSSVSTE